MNKFYIAVLFCILSAQTFANENVGISVNGIGVINVTPDTFKVHFTIKQRGISASKTKSLVDKQSQLFISASKKLGIKSKDIVSAQLNMRAFYDERYRKTSIRKSISASDSSNANHNQNMVIEVSRRITVKLSKLEQYDKLLDKAVINGVTDISPLEIKYSKSEEAYQKALTLALKDAHRKASTIAKTSNQKVGELIFVSESGNYNERSLMRASSVQGGSFQSTLGEYQVSARISAKYSIESK